MDSRPLTQQELEEWALHPVTQAKLAEWEESRLETLEAWAREVFVGSTLEQGALQNATAIGGVRVLTELIDSVRQMQRPFFNEIPLED